MALLVMVPVATLAAFRMAAAVAPAAVTDWMRVVTAYVASTGVRAVGVPVALDGTLLRLHHHVLRIDLACTALEWFVLFAAAVAVVPVARDRRLAAILLGIPAIAVLNIVRLVAVAVVSEYDPSRFIFVHDYVLQGSIALAVGGMWALFMWLSRNDWSPGWS